MNSMLFHLLERFHLEGRVLVESCDVGYALQIHTIGSVGRGEELVCEPGFSPRIRVAVQLRKPNDPDRIIAFSCLARSEQAALDELEAALEAAAR